ncbi:N protein 2 [Diadegma semiclausum ichnovirus]|nr:N protein 2 [Diadegma semiclausum ichnovirus]
MVCTEEDRHLPNISKQIYRKFKNDDWKYSHVGEYEFAVVKVRPDSESSSELPLPRLTLKRVRTNKLAEGKIDQVQEEIKREVEDELVKVDTASEERSTLVVPLKKRRYVEPLADDNSETTICTVEEKHVLKQSIAIEKAHKPKAMSSDESDGKEERRDKKKQQHMQKQPEAELPQPTNEPSSSSMMHAPCQDEARAGTSAAGSGSSPKQNSLEEFWLEELRKNFNELEYSKVLRDAEFTEQQSEILQQSFAQLSRKMSYIKANSERFLKTHKCRRCAFSISHQCMPLDFMRTVPFGTELMRQTLIVPRQTVACDCGFAFSHTHLKRTQRPVKESYAERYIPHLQLYNRSVDVSCPKCYTKIIMNNPEDNVCCELSTWDCVSGNERELFYTGIEKCCSNSGTDAPLLDEFFACNKGCCLIYHRCFEKVEVPGTSGSSPG